MRFVLGWWRFAQAVVRGLTEPAADIVVADRPFEESLRESAGFHALDRAGEFFERAAPGSRTLATVAAARDEWRMAARPARIAATGATVAIGSATALILQLTLASRFDPYLAAVPSIALLTGLAILGARAFIAGLLDRLDC